ncbi:MAG: response regulator [Gemmatimonadetes bacterium]|nr:response regulator [Gemmatimonadota bacterium]
MRPTDRSLFALATLWVAYAAWVLSGAALTHVLANDLLFAVFPAVGLVALWRASTRPELSEHAREGWRWLAVGMAINLLSVFQWLVFDLAGPRPALPAWTSLSYLLYYPCVTYGLTRFSTARRLRAEARRGWLDGAVVTTGAMAVAWYLSWTFTNVWVGTSLADTLVSLGTLGSDLFIVWATTTLAREEQDPDTRPAMLILTSAVVAMLAADIWLSVWQLQGRYRSGVMSDTASALGYALMTAAPLVHRRSAAEPSTEERPVTARALLWPVSALAAVMTLLLVDILRTDEVNLGVLATAMLIVVALELARQADIRRQNRTLARARAAADARFRSLVQYSHDMTFIADRAGRLLYASPSALRQLGMGTSTLTNGDLLALVHPADRARLGNQLLTVRPSTAPQPVTWRMGTDGQWRDVEGILTDLTDDATVVGIVLNVRDVSERERLEEQLRQSQKMDAVGRLAGGIAHDFNNILAAVMANAQLLRETTDGPEAMDIEDAARRGAALTRQLLQFSRGEAPAPGPVAVGDVVHGMAPMLRRLITRDIALDFDVATTDAVVWVDRGQLEQVVLNLVVNARDAMPEGGTLRIMAGVDGGRAVLEVTDTGIGMDEHTRVRVFEPFFTTKPRGRGTGLGLATVYGIVSKAGGEIEVESSPGKGTTMRVRLPLAVAPVTTATPADTPAVREPGKLLLVVDDEDALRLSISRFLERRGYRVLVAHDGLEALALLEDSDWTVDLLLTDIVMPRMGGIELAERVRGRPGAPAIICMTGHAGRAAEAPPDAPWHPDRVMIKPFELHDLAERIAEMLGAPAH